jgi:hypothetical protein
MRMRKKRRKKKIGTRLVLCLAALAAVAAQAGEKKTTAEPYALVAGTVFHASGFALPNATVTLIPSPQTSGSATKAKKQQAISDSRGEFVFRVPAAAMRYSVKAEAKGRLSQEKFVTIGGEERVDVTFQLEPESE